MKLANLMRDSVMIPALTAYAWLCRSIGKYQRPRRYNALYAIADEIRPHRIMEIGTWIGERAERMIQTAQKYYPPQEIEYYGFDLFETMEAKKFAVEMSKQPPSQEEVEERLSKTGVRVHLYKGDTIEILPRVTEKLPNMDLIFIDGGHSIETIANDWKYASRLMGPQTVVVFDDYWPDRLDAGAKPIVDAIDREHYDVRLLPTVDVFLNSHFGRLVIQFAAVGKK
jgi:predicted O-methyltransferase YrrM